MHVTRRVTTAGRRDDTHTFLGPDAVPSVPVSRAVNDTRDVPEKYERFRFVFSVSFRVRFSLKLYADGDGHRDNVSSREFHAPVIVVIYT